MPVIHIEGLSKSFGSNLVFQDINVDIEKGDCISVIGPSGCGKSTFLRCINLLEQPTGGRVFIDGQEITAKGAPLDQIRRKMGMVYQTFNLFSHKTVLENVMMAPMQLQGLSKEDAIHLAMECLTQVGMAERADYMPSSSPAARSSGPHCPVRGNEAGESSSLTSPPQPWTHHGGRGAGGHPPAGEPGDDLRYRHP